MTEKDIKHIIEYMDKLKDISLKAYDGEIETREQVEYPFNVIKLHLYEMIIKEVKESVKIDI